MMAEAAPNGNNAEISTASAPSASSSSATSLGVLARSIEVPRYAYAFFSPVINAPTSGSTKRNHNRNTAPKIPVGGNASKINSVPFGLHTRNISLNVSGTSEKFLSV